jgi:hypothetical protein
MSCLRGNTEGVTSPPEQRRRRTSERRVCLARGSPGSGDADPGGADPTRERWIRHGAVDPASGPSGGRSGEQRPDPASGWPPPASGRGDGADPVSRAVAHGWAWRARG